MSILFCTPCYGDQATLGYMKSVINLHGDLLQVGVDHDFLFTGKESLIQRARNTSAAAFMATDYAKLMFIDADIEFTSEGVASLWNMNADIAAGLYPMKRRDYPLSAWKDGKLVEVRNCPDEPFAVDYAGTGFMMIDRGVFEAFRDQWPEREHEEGGYKECFAWFDPRVIDDGAGPYYASEDYAFCRDARELGYKIMADPAVTLLHHGTFAYGERKWH